MKPTALANTESSVPVGGADGSTTRPPTAAITVDAGSAAVHRSREPEFTAPDAEDDDLAWARPRPSASTRLKATAAVLALLFAGTIGFAAGTKYGRSHAPIAAGRGGFGRGGFGANGFPGGGFGGGSASGTGSTGSVTAADGASGAATPAAPATTSPNLGGLLPK